MVSIAAMLDLKVGGDSATREAAMAAFRKAWDARNAAIT